MKYNYKGQEFQVQLAVDFYTSNDQTALFLVNDHRGLIDILTTNTDHVDEDCVGIRGDERQKAQWLHEQGFIVKNSPEYSLSIDSTEIEFYQISHKLKEMIAEALEISKYNEYE